MVQEAGDPTLDEMMCFIKPPFKWTPRDMDEADKRADETAPPTCVVPAAAKVALDQLPAGLLDSVKSLLASTREAFVPAIVNAIESLVLASSKDLGPMVDLLKLQLHSGMAGLTSLIRKLEHQTDHVDLNHDAICNALPLQELILVMQALLRKSKSSPGQMTVNEMMAVSVIKDTFGEMLTGISESSEAKPEATVLEDHPSGSSASPRARAPGSGPTPAEMEDLLSKVVATRPELSRPDLLETAGFPAKAIPLILAKAGGDKVALAQWSSYLDAKAFEELCAALAPVIAGTDNTPLTFETCTRKSPWWSALMAVLGAPDVRLASAVKTMASLVGLGKVIEMYDVAQEYRRAAETKPARQSIKVAELSEHARIQIESAFRTMAVNLREITFEIEHGKTRTVKNVGEIVRARIHMTGGKDLASAELLRTPSGDYEVDVTDLLTEIALSTESGTLTLDDERCQDLISRSRLPPPAKDVIAPFSRVYQFGDIRRGLGGLAEFTGVTHTADASYTLTIRYTASDQAISAATALPLVREVLARLKNSSQVRELHSNDAEYTFFKLNEWMQVEMFEVFAASMSHTPWYRFPFMQMVHLYWSTFLQEAQYCVRTFGIKKALGGMAFLTDVIPGIFMLFMFGQMQVMALPLRAYLGSTNYNPSTLIEQFVVKTGHAEPDWNEIDARITDVIQIIPSLYTVIVPTFKAMTEILLKLSCQADIQILQISNQDKIQVRVMLRDEEQKRALAGKEGCAILMEYTYPVDGTGKAPPKQVALCVEVPFLLDVIRFCAEHGIRVCQVYDFYSG
jgi:hypothetical protein